MSVGDTSVGYARSCLSLVKFVYIRCGGVDSYDQNAISVMQVNHLLSLFLLIRPSFRFSKSVSIHALVHTPSVHKYKMF
jgi:hypothetical protein